MPGRGASCRLAAQVKTRLQSEGRHTSADRRYSGSADAVKRIWQTEGAQGLAGARRRACVCTAHVWQDRAARGMLAATMLFFLYGFAILHKALASTLTGCSCGTWCCCLVPADI